MLLKVVAFAGDVADHFALVGQADLGHLAKRRVRLLRGRRIDAGADAALLRILLHRRDLGFGLLRLATLADQLVDRRHEALHFLQVTLLRRKMRKGASAAFSAPQAFASHAAVFSSNIARADSVWPVSHHQPAGEAAYSRERLYGSTGEVCKGRRRADFAAVQRGFSPGVGAGAFWIKILNSGRGGMAAPGRGRMARVVGFSAVAGRSPAIPVPAFLRKLEFPFRPCGGAWRGGSKGSEILGPSLSRG